MVKFILIVFSMTISQLTFAAHSSCLRNEQEINHGGCFECNGALQKCVNGELIDTLKALDCQKSIVGVTEEGCGHQVVEAVSSPVQVVPTSSSEPTQSSQKIFR